MKQVHPVLRAGAGLLAATAVIAAVVAVPASGQLRAKTPWAQVRPKADNRYLNNTRTMVSAEQLVAIAGTASASVDCPRGWQALGGGVDFDDETATVEVITDGPIVAGDLATAPEGRNGPSTGWEVSVLNLDVAAQTFVVGVICSR